MQDIHKCLFWLYFAMAVQISVYRNFSRQNTLKLKLKRSAQGPYNRPQIESEGF
jgi:hypothetical protein